MNTSPPSVQKIHLKGSLIGNTKARLRLLAGCNDVTWRCYLRLTGKPMPDPQKIAFILEAYPRSGNTYAEHMLRIMCPELRWLSHTHSAGALRWAKKHDIPAIILIRDPLESAVSLYIYRMQRVSLELCLKKWAAFYEQARRNNIATFITFENLVSDTEASLTAALTNLGQTSSIQHSLPANPRASFEASHDHDKWHLKTVYGLCYGDEQGNCPSIKRASLKNDILREVRLCKNTGLLDELNLCNQIAASFAV